MGDAVQQRRRHLCVPEHGRPLAEAEVGGDHDTRVFIQLREQVEQQCATGLAERQVAQFVQ